MNIKALLRRIELIWNSAKPLQIHLFHIQNPGLFRIRGIFKSLSNIKDDQAYSEPWHIQNSLLKHFQGYLVIFRDTGAYSATLTGAKTRGGRGEASFALFKNRKR